MAVWYSPVTVTLIRLTTDASIRFAGNIKSPKYAFHNVLGATLSKKATGNEYVKPNRHTANRRASLAVTLRTTPC